MGIQWTYGLEFWTYDGDNVILYDPYGHEFVELSDEMVKIADSEFIEGLDTPNKTMKGKWDTTSDRAQTSICIFLFVSFQFICINSFVFKAICGVPAIPPDLNFRIVGGSQPANSIVLFFPFKSKMFSKSRFL